MMSDEPENSEDSEEELSNAADELVDEVAGADDSASAEGGDDEGEDAAADWGDALSEQSDAEAEAAKDPVSDFPPAELDELVADSSAPESTTLETLLDIPVSLAMELGRTKISIRNLLKLNQGSVVELDRLAGEPLDVLVNGCLIAHGEVVVVNEKFGIRLTDVISTAERVKKLQ